MAKASEGNIVKVAYTGRLKDGTVFDSSQGRQPLEFTLGSGQVIPGFDAGILGMEVGEKKTIEIPCENAYGPHYDEAVIVVNRTDLPPDLNPSVGDKLKMSQPDGNAMIVIVTEADDEKIKLDANHPLAGKDLIFDVELVEAKSGLAI